jgi:thioredoxin reductase (NADPH)
VVGGGDSALQEALTLADAVGRVVLLHRDDALDGQAAYRRRVAEHERIEVRYGTIVEEVLGDGAVTGVRIRDAAGTAGALELDAVFVYVGLEPNSDLDVHDLGRDASGRITTDAALATTLPGVFAAGICRAGAAGRAAASAGDGATAAAGAHRYLGGS